MPPSHTCWEGDQVTKTNTDPQKHSLQVAGRFVGCHFHLRSVGGDLRARSTAMLLGKDAGRTFRSSAGRRAGMLSRDESWCPNVAHIVLLALHQVLYPIDPSMS